MSAKRDAYEKALSIEAEKLKDLGRILLKPDFSRLDNDDLTRMGREILVFTNNLVDLALTEDRKLRFACAQAYKQLEEKDDGDAREDAGS